MSGLIIKFKNSVNWYARFKIEGQLYQKSLKTPNKRLAEKLADQYRTEVLEGLHDVGVEIITIRQCFELYRSSKPNDRNFGVTTVRITSFINEHLINIDKSLVELASKHLQKLLTIQTAEGKKLSTIKHIIGFITRAVNFAKKNGYKIPELEPPVIKVKNDKLRFFSNEEEKALLAELDPTRPIRAKASYEKEPNSTFRFDMQSNYDILVMLLDSGARLNEIASLSWNDIDLVKGEIHLYRSKVNNESILHMTDRVKKLLTERLKMKRCMYVFPNRKDMPKTNFAPIRRAIKNAGLTEATIHTARHTTASRLVQAGVPLYEVSHILGHSSTKMTERYAHLNKSEVTKRAADVLNRRTNSNKSTYILPESYTHSYTDSNPAISIGTPVHTSILDTINNKI